MNSKKQKIIDSAMSLIAEKGYKASTMRQIAKKAGVTAGSLYNHIKSKTEILLEIQTKFIDNLIKAIEEYPTKAPAKKKIENVIINIIKAIHTNKPAYKITIDEFYHFPKHQQKKLNIRADKLENLIKKIIREGIKNGEFKNPYQDIKTELFVKMAAFFLLGACNYTTRWLDTKGALSYEEIGKIFSSLFLHGAVEFQNKCH